MKNCFSIYLIALFFNLSFSQDKKTIFYDENNKVVSKFEYQRRANHFSNLSLNFENDTLIGSILIKRKIYGKLNDSIFTTLKKMFSLENELTKELIVIIYYPGKDRCNNAREKMSPWNIFDNDYLRKLNKIASNNHLWIYKNDEDLEYFYPKKVKWQADKDQFVEDLFFNNHYPCFSSVVLDKQGNYISYLGEFGKQVIWEIALELKDKK